MTVPVFESEALLQSITRLKAEQKAMREAKKNVTKSLRNAEKRRARLKKRARQLSDVDLVAVLQMRGVSGSSSSSTPSSASGTPAPATAAVTDDDMDK